jgi:hypothetical protein
MFKEYFIEKHELLLDEKHIENILRLVPEDIRQLASQRWKESSDNSLKRWADLEASVAQVPEKKKTSKHSLIILV